ncbi:MAG: PD-(D/E)XK nuclease family protein [Candidatus Eisenbacteria bacterium]
MATDNNLFGALHRWAAGQDENFTTGALVYLLQYLVKTEPTAALAVLNTLCGERLKWSPADADKVSIRCQACTERGIPDIKISTDDRLVYVEVKVESGFGRNQLSRYRDQLKHSDYNETLLVVLTMGSIEVPAFSKQSDVLLRWHHVAECLETLRIKDQAAIFVVAQFIEFLKRRGLAMDAVSWELVAGVRSLRNLVDMLSEALSANGVQYSFSAGGRWYGYYVENKAFFVGLYYDSPNCIRFKTYDMALNAGGKDLEMGEMEGDIWTNVLHLDSEETHFFARTKASQIKCLEDFVKLSLDYGRKLAK